MCENIIFRCTIHLSISANFSDRFFQRTDAALTKLLSPSMVRTVLGLTCAIAQSVPFIKGTLGHFRRMLDKPIQVFCIHSSILYSHKWWLHPLFKMSQWWNAPKTLSFPLFLSNIINHGESDVQWPISI